MGRREKLYRKRYWKKLKNDPVRYAKHIKKRKADYKRRYKIIKKIVLRYVNKRAKDPRRQKQYLKKQRESKNRERYNLKIDVFTHYSPLLLCVCCKEHNVRFLTIDHINGRKRIGHRSTFGGYRLYKWLKKRYYPKGFQVLCMNCNWGRRVDGICPHKVIT